MATEETKKTVTKSLLAKINRASRTRTHVSELAQALINEFGGAQGYAREYHAVYEICKENKNISQRVKMLQSAAKLVEIDTELNGRGTSVQNMEDQDLDLEMTDIIKIAMQATDDETRNELGLTAEEIDEMRSREEAAEETPGPRSPPPPDPDHDDDGDDDAKPNRNWADDDDDLDDDE